MTTETDIAGRRYKHARTSPAPYLLLALRAELVSLSHFASKGLPELAKSMIANARRPA